MCFMYKRTFSPVKTCRANLTTAKCPRPSVLSRSYSPAIFPSWWRFSTDMSRADWWKDQPFVACWSSAVTSPFPLSRLTLDEVVLGAFILFPCLEVVVQSLRIDRDLLCRAKYSGLCCRSTRLNSVPSIRDLRMRKVKRKRIKMDFTPNATVSARTNAI